VASKSVSEKTSIGSASRVEKLKPISLLTSNVDFRRQARAGSQHWLSWPWKPLVRARRLVDSCVDCHVNAAQLLVASFHVAKLDEFGPSRRPVSTKCVVGRPATTTQYGFAAATPTPSSLNDPEVSPKDQPRGENSLTFSPLVQHKRTP